MRFLKRPSGYRLIIASISIICVCLLYLASCPQVGGDPLPSESPSPSLSPIPSPTPGAPGVSTIAGYLTGGKGNIDGNTLYIADVNNRGIRSVNLSTGQTDTMAGGMGRTGSTDGIGKDAQFDIPLDVATDGTTIYVADANNRTIRAIDRATKAVSVYAGSTGVSAVADGSLSDARFFSPSRLLLHAGILYVGDSDGIRAINTSTGQVSTIAGNPTSPGLVDNENGLNARFNNISDFTCDDNYLYVADAFNNSIRRVSFTPPHAVSTLAGSLSSDNGLADGAGAAARFDWPSGITLFNGTLYVSDSGNNAIRSVLPATGETLTVCAGLGSSDGSLSQARFNWPADISEAGGILYISDYGNNTVRRLDLAVNTVSTFIGTPGGSAASVDGSAGEARFGNPLGLVVTADRVFVADYLGAMIRSVRRDTGVVSTLAGVSNLDESQGGITDGYGTSARFYLPMFMAVDGNNLYVSDYYASTIRRIDIQTTYVSTFAGIAGNPGHADLTGTAATFSNPGGLAIHNNILYVADTGNSVIRAIDLSTAAVSTVAGLAETPDSVNGTGTAARFISPAGLACDDNYLYIADMGDHTIRRMNFSTLYVDTIAGSPGSPGNVNETGSAALFDRPIGLAVGGATLYISSFGASAVRALDLDTMLVSTLAGKADEAGWADGTLTESRFNKPVGLALDGKSLYVSDYENNKIRLITLP